MTAPMAEAPVSADAAAGEREPIISVHFCARGNHGPCRGMVYDIRTAAMERCECKCHADKPIKRQRNQWS